MFPRAGTKGVSVTSSSSERGNRIRSLPTGETKVWTDPTRSFPTGGTKG